MRDLAERAWKIYRVLSAAPSQLKPVCDEILLMTGALRMIDEDVQNLDLTGADERALRDLMIGSSAVITELGVALGDVRSKEGSLDAVLSIQSNILDQTRRLQSFQLTLRGYLQERITSLLKQVLEQKSEEFQPTAIRDWEVLSSELQKLGISATLLNEEYFFINDWLKENLPSGEDRTAVEEDDDVLPDYTPGAQQENIAEKVQSLEQTARHMALNDPVISVATSSKAAEPPPYTFDDSNDRMGDHEFALHIQRAVEKEVHYQSLDYEQNPVLKHRPYSWLPPDTQQDYVGRHDIIRDVDAMSFTMMAYHTAPRNQRDATRLIDVLKVSYEFRPDTPSHDTVVQAIAALEFISKVTKRFALFANTKSAKSHLSDLDELEFAYSTVAALEGRPEFPNDMGFPQQDFDLARKSSYMLLTYIMGLLELLSVVFPGQKYASRRLREVESIWIDKRVGDRVAWVEKQLAGWEKISDAVHVCREWHLQSPSLLAHAVTALTIWQDSERSFFPDAGGCGCIELTMLSATRLPKPNFRTPTAWAKLTLYSEISGEVRFKDKTQVAPKSQNPVWDEKFIIEWQKGDKWIDIDIFDRIAGIEQHLGKCRIRFSYLPGVEANFANRSMLYSYDEECEFPIQLMFTSGKGKEAASSTARVRLKWDGREEEVRRMGLPTRPPGKMFRQDYAGIPMSPTERAALRLQRQ